VLLSIMPPGQQPRDASARVELAAGLTARMLNANINSAFSVPKGRSAASRTETASQYAYRPPQDLNKDAHLRKDPIKLFVEKALQLHDDRKGMPVVASPIWGTKQ
jgi:hypothetical protein